LFSFYPVRKGFGAILFSVKNQNIIRDIELFAFQTEPKRSSPCQVEWIDLSIFEKIAYPQVGVGGK